MFKFIRAAWPALFAIALVFTVQKRWARADDTAAPPMAPAVARLEPIAQPRILPPPNALRDEVLAALRQWNSKALALHETRDSDLETWATAIADGSPSRTAAIRLAAQGSQESSFFRWVVDFSCNRGAWTACDHGKAFGPFQMWENGVPLMGASPEAQVAEALRRMEKSPQAWTTWKAARAQAAAWLNAR